MTSIGTKIRQLSGLVDTKDVTEWENNYIQHILTHTAHGQRTTGLTARQLACIDKIYEKHFA